MREGPVEYEVDLRQGPEDRPVPRSAREPRGGGALRARPAARLLQLPRRVRAAAGAAVPDGGSGRHLGRRRGAHPRERRAQRRAAPAGARGQRLRRAAPARDGPASATTRSCSTRRRSPRTRRRCRTRSPATRRSTCARCGCCRRAATSSRCSCSYNVNEEMFGDDAARGVGRQPHAGDRRREAHAGPRSPGAGRRARDATT